MHNVQMDEIIKQLEEIDKALNRPYALIGPMYSHIFNSETWDKIGVEHIDLMDSLAIANDVQSIRNTARLLLDYPCSTKIGRKAINIVSQHMINTADQLNVKPAPPSQYLNICNLCHRLVVGYKLCSHHNPKYNHSDYRRRHRLQDRLKKELEKIKKDGSDVIISTMMSKMECLNTEQILNKIDAFDTPISPKEYESERVRKRKKAFTYLLRDDEDDGPVIFLFKDIMDNPMTSEIMARWLAWGIVDQAKGKPGRKEAVKMEAIYSLKNDGLSNKQIAGALEVSERTIRRKLNKR